MGGVPEIVVALISLSGYQMIRLIISNTAVH
jgi:hypothetical protein